VNKIARIGLICIGFLLSLTQASAQTDDNEVGQFAVIVVQDGNPEIFLMNADGSNPLNLTKNEEWDSDPQWSPDGERIAFVSGSPMENTEDIYVMHADGTQLMNVTNSEGNDGLPAWSPDGTQLAFISARSGNAEIYTLDLSDEDYLPVQITESERPVFIDGWLPDGSGLLYNTSDGNLHGSLNIVTLDGAEIETVHTVDGLITQPLLSPDGSKILFSTFDDAINLYVVNIDGSNLINLSEIAGASVDYFTWSPDSSQVAFGARDVEGERISNIYVVDADGSNLRALTQFTDEGFCTGISWSPDGTQLAFSRNSTWDMYVVDVDGENLVNLTADSEDTYIRPVWRPLPDEG
jgi:TolB protein